MTNKADSDWKPMSSLTFKRNGGANRVYRFFYSALKPFVQI